MATNTPSSQNVVMSLFIALFAMYHVMNFLVIRVAYHDEIEALDECPTDPLCDWECVKRVSHERDIIRTKFQDKASFLVRQMSVLIQGEPRSIEYYVAKEERRNNCKMTDERFGNEACFDAICRKISTSTKTSNEKVDFLHGLIKGLIKYHVD